MNDLFHPKKPWPHQKDAVALIIDAIINREHTCVTAPTGAGKTICITAVIRWCAETNRKLILYTNRILLTEQTSKVLDEHGISYGIIAASMPKRRATLRDIQLASVQTVHRRCLVGGQALFPADVVLVDEFDQCCNGATLQLLERHKAQGATIIGLTATPIGVSHVAPKLAIAGTVSQCRHVGALVPAVYKAPSELDFSKLEVTDSGEFNYKEVKKLYNPAIFGHVYDSWCEHNPDARATLGFAPGVQESKWFVDQFEARSADGTMIPYFVVHKDEMEMDGSNPTLLYGYGGFEVSLLPSYSATVGKLWLERGGVYVVANTRGGGEFGPRWHEAARQDNRQRAHEDFQAVALDLIARGITSQPRLGIMGGSQGGLFMGAMLTQRPDLINAAVIQVPLFDMLRFHRLLAGASWIAEYGDPDIAEQRAWIEPYSPYQRLAAGQPYPEVFIHTSTKDDRVHPGHARKAAARLSELGYPVLFYENTDGGHAAGANLRETARRLALEYTYLTRRLMDASGQEE
jgi:acetyl esterase/lipase